MCLSGTRLPLQTPFGTWLHTQRPQGGETVPDQTVPAFISRQIKDQMDEVTALGEFSQNQVTDKDATFSETKPVFNDDA